MRGFYQGFGWNTTTPQANSAKPIFLIDQGHIQAKVCGTESR
jgi:hypothetical protein